MNKLNLFKNSEVSLKDFLKNYWHKKPLLIRNAISSDDLSTLPNKSQLIQLSCHDDIQSRIVFKNSDYDYEVEYGPFLEDDFDNISDSQWNLLVSDIDKWQPKSREILKYFNFIRNWIFDDIMVSCGSQGGTVGPHTDHYDVFLVQVHGQRQWQFGLNKIYDPKLMSDQALKLMSEFCADEDHELKAGDVLYIPPEVAHYGIAASDDCVTCSIGMRTPSHSELLTSYVDHLAQNISDDHRFEEPDFDNQPKIGEFNSKDLKNISDILTQHLSVKNKSLINWFGKFITEYRSLFFEFNQYQQGNLLEPTKDLKLSPFSKSCYFKNKHKAKLFVNGYKYKSSLVLAEIICNKKYMTDKQIAQFNGKDLKIIEELFENGSLINA